jgi:hypothetical protein
MDGTQKSREVQGTYPRATSARKEDGALAGNSLRDHRRSPSSGGRRRQEAAERELRDSLHSDATRCSGEERCSGPVGRDSLEEGELHTQAVLHLARSFPPFWTRTGSSVGVECDGDRQGRPPHRPCNTALAILALRRSLHSDPTWRECGQQQRARAARGPNCARQVLDGLCSARCAFP